MGWASAAIDRLRQGQVVTLRPHGRSMVGRVNDGNLVTVEPLGERELRAGNILLVRLHGREYLHLVNPIQGGRSLIGNTRGGINGWVGRQHSEESRAGVATKVTSP